MSNAVAKLSIAHDSMMDYILENPGCTLREIAAYLGYTVPWVCRVLNSDIFQARLAARRQDVEGLIAEDIPAKLKATAGLAIERIQEKIAVSEDPDYLLDAFDKVMHRAGYAPKATPTPMGAGPVQNQQNNFFLLSKEDLANMRQGVHRLETVPALLPEPAPKAVDNVELDIDISLPDPLPPA